MKYVIGNWKMNPQSFAEAVALATAVRDGLKDFNFETNVGLCPSFVHIPAVKNIIEGTKIILGAQNSYFAQEGAFTGEVSLNQLSEFCQMVIVGHSERRQLFLETDESVNKKLKAILSGFARSGEAGQSTLQPILCVGEDMDTRNAGNQIAFVVSQLQKGLEGLLSSEVQKIVIAYEPIWAIGTGIVATSDQAKEMIADIRSTLEKMYEPGMGEKVAILYGGSTNGDNVEDLVANSGCDGFLVGGASLKPEQFLKICKVMAKS